MKWQEFRPVGSQLVIKADEQQRESLGGIILTDDLPLAANVAYYTGTILKVGSHVNEDLMTDENLIGKRVAYRRYLSEVIVFNEKDEDNKTCFVLHVKDIEGFLDPGVKISVI